MSFEITGVSALEILDSRGRPTLQTTLTLSDGTTAVAGVPSGASTGTREAVELRDGDTTRFSGSGVLTAVGNVNGEIADLLRGQKWESLSAVDGRWSLRTARPTRRDWARTRPSGSRWPLPGRWPPPAASPCMSGCPASVSHSCRDW